MNCANSHKLKVRNLVINVTKNNLQEFQLHLILCLEVMVFSMCNSRKKLQNIIAPSWQVKMS